MAWFTENWFWILTFIAFIAMHMFGHGGHGGHRGHGGGDRPPRANDKANDDVKPPVNESRSGGHRH